MGIESKPVAFTVTHLCPSVATGLVFLNYYFFTAILVTTNLSIDNILKNIIEFGSLNLFEQRNKGNVSNTYLKKSTLK